MNIKNIKYRIVTCDSDSYPFVLERKFRFFSLWNCVGVYATLDQAENDVARKHREYVERKIAPPGTVVQVFHPVDLTALMLKEKV